MTAEDFKDPGDEMNMDELDSVAGGGKCVCPLVGIGAGDGMECACLAGGGGVDGNKRPCKCIVAGSGKN